MELSDTAETKFTLILNDKVNRKCVQYKIQSYYFMSVNRRNRQSDSPLDDDVSLLIKLSVIGSMNIIVSLLKGLGKGANERLNVRRTRRYE